MVGPDLVTVFMTAPDADEAERMARTLVEERLAACANIVQDVVSVYRWEGEVQRDGESLVILKTTAAGVEALKSRAMALHPYDVPEFLALPVVEGHEAYMDWVRGEVG